MPDTPSQAVSRFIDLVGWLKAWVLSDATTDIDLGAPPPSDVATPAPGTIIPSVRKLLQTISTAPLSARIDALQAALNLLTASLGTQPLPFDTLAHLNADLTHADKVFALVYNDATDANNGLYIKNGASGVGAWVKSKDRVDIETARAVAVETGEITRARKAEGGKADYRPPLAPALTGVNAISGLFGTPGQIVHFPHGPNGAGVTVRRVFDQYVMDTYQEPLVFEITGTAAAAGDVLPSAGIIITAADLAAQGVVPNDDGSQTVSIVFTLLRGSTVNCNIDNDPVSTNGQAWTQMRFSDGAAFTNTPGSTPATDVLFQGAAGPTSTGGYQGSADAAWSGHTGSSYIDAYEKTFIHQNLVQKATLGGNAWTHLQLLSFGKALAAGPVSYRVRAVVVKGATIDRTQSYCATRRLDAGPHNRVGPENIEFIATDGDSYDDGVYPLKDKSWPSKIADWTKFNITSGAVSGSTLDDMLDRLRYSTTVHGNVVLANVKPSVLFVLAGRNDTGYDLTFDEYLDSMRGYVETASSLGIPRDRIVLCTEIDDGYWTHGFQTGLYDVAEELGCRFLGLIPYAKSLNTTQYAGWWANGHPGTRTNEYYSAQITEYINREFGAPGAAIKVRRGRFGNGAKSLMTGATAKAVGAGYAAADVLTLVGGSSTQAAQITVDTVDGSGHIVTFHVSRAGAYTASAASFTVTGGTGAGAVFKNAVWNHDAYIFATDYDRNKLTIGASVPHTALDGSGTAGGSSDQYFDELQPNIGGFVYQTVRDDMIDLRNGAGIAIGSVNGYTLSRSCAQITIPAVPLNVANPVVVAPTRDRIEIWVHDRLAAPFEADERNEGFDTTGGPYTAVVGDTFTSSDPAMVDSMAAPIVFTVKGITAAGKLICSPQFNPAPPTIGGAYTLTRTSGTGTTPITYSQSGPAHAVDYYANFAKPEGHFVKLTALGGGRYAIPNVLGTMSGRTFTFLFDCLDGSAVLSDLAVEWDGVPGYPAPRTPGMYKLAKGAELLAQPLCDTAGHMAGWTQPGGAVTVGTTTDAEYPLGAAGFCELTSAKSIQQTIAFAADNTQDREIEVRVACRVKRAINAHATYPFSSNINNWTFDHTKLRLDVINSTTSPQRAVVGIGLRWVRFRAVIPVGATTVDLKLSAVSDTIQAAIVSVKFMEAPEKVYVPLRIDDLLSADAKVYGVPSPCSGTITNIFSSLEGHALAGADATLTGKIGATAITGGVVTISLAGSVVGDPDSAQPTANNAVVVGSRINFTVGGGNTNAAAFSNLLIEITKT